MPGPSGAGKSTLCISLAEKDGWFGTVDLSDDGEGSSEAISISEDNGLSIEGGEKLEW